MDETGKIGDSSIKMAFFVDEIGKCPLGMKTEKDQKSLLVFLCYVDKFRFNKVIKNSFYGTRNIRDAWDSPGTSRPSGHVFPLQ